MTTRISLIQICGDGTDVYLFDITVLQDRAFSEGKLRALLESQSVLKVLFDVRADADSLWRNFRTKIANVYENSII